MFKHANLLRNSKMRSARFSPCIYLARRGDLGILQKLFGRIVLPEAVWRELTVEGRRLPGASEFQAGLDGWVTVQTTRQTDLDGIMQAEKLERGEVEAIHLSTYS